MNQVLSDTVTSQMTQMASESDAKCLVFVSSNSGEGYLNVAGHQGDRNNLDLWNNGDALINAISNACAQTIVIVHTVGPVNMEAWIEKSNVKGVVFAHLPGQEAGSSLADVLFGDYAPSGRLPYTIGKKLSDYGAAAQIIRSGSGVIQQPFSEGLYVDYKYFDKNNITPRYPFGFGLSYTTFEYGNLKITQTGTPSAEPGAPPARAPVPTYATNIPAASEAAWPSNFQRIRDYVYPYLDNPGSVTRGNYPYPQGYSTTEKTPSKAGGRQGGNPALFEEIYHVSVEVTNKGTVTAKAVPQLYLEFPSDSGYDTPIRQLRGFNKVELKGGEKKTVEFSLTRKDLSVWDVRLPPPNNYMRSNSNNYRLSVNNGSCPSPARQFTEFTLETTRVIFRLTALPLANALPELPTLKSLLRLRLQLPVPPLQP